jgi:hypothetical protein
MHGIARFVTRVGWDFSPPDSTHLRHPPDLPYRMKLGTC